MAINDFIGFASNGNANIASQAEYAAAAEQGIGMQPGPASSKLSNKVWRQGANMAAALGRIAAARGYNALDNGDLNGLQSSIDDMISVGTFNRMYFSQTSGSFIAPRTGVYRITLKGGGGGGGPAGSQQGGCGGGEGGKVVFYVTLTKSTSYPYTIGAGGAGGNAAANTAGGSGGFTSITISGNTYQAYGGLGASDAGAGQAGIGASGSLPTGASGIILRGASGATGTFFDTSSGFATSGSGGGEGGGSGKLYGSGIVGVQGGGGAGGGRYANTAYDGGTGGDGYILVEYAG